MIWQKLTMRTTSLVITTLVIVLGIYDGICVTVGLYTGQDVQITVSSYFVQIGFTHPMIVFCIAFICGHLFGYMKLEPAKRLLAIWRHNRSCDVRERNGKMVWGRSIASGGEARICSQCYPKVDQQIKGNK